MSLCKESKCLGFHLGIFGIKRLTLMSVGLRQDPGDTPINYRGWSWRSILDNLVTTASIESMKSYFLCLMHFAFSCIFLHQKTSIFNPRIMSLPGLRSELPHAGRKCFWQGEGGESILAAGAVLGQILTANCAHDVTWCDPYPPMPKSLLFMRNPQWNLPPSMPVSGMLGVTFSLAQPLGHRSVRLLKLVEMAMVCNGYRLGPLIFGSCILSWK